MVDSGALEGEPVELLDGLLVEMSHQGTDHADVIMWLTRHLASAQALLRVQLPLEVPPDSVPEPNLALIAESSGSAHHPRVALLVIEVAVTLHRIARNEKARLYARAAVPTYWIVDVPARAIEVHTDLAAEGYRHHETCGPGGRIAVPDPNVADLDVDWLFERIS